MFFACPGNDHLHCLPIFIHGSCVKLYDDDARFLLQLAGSDGAGHRCLFWIIFYRNCSVLLNVESGCRHIKRRWPGGKVDDVWYWFIFCWICRLHSASSFSSCWKRDVQNSSCTSFVFVLCRIIVVQIRDLLIERVWKLLYWYFCRYPNTRPSICDINHTRWWIVLLLSSGCSLFLSFTCSGTGVAVFEC